MAAGDRTSRRIQPRVVRCHAHAVAPGQHLHGERLVQLEQADVGDREPGLREDALRRGHGADSHQVGLDARVREADEPHRGLEPELGGHRLGGEQPCGRAVGETCRVPCGHAPACPERRPQGREAFERRVRPQELVPGGDAPALVAEDAHRDDRAGHDPVLPVPGPGGAALALEGIAVGCLPRQLREGVVEVLGGLSHHGRALVDQPLADEARVEIDLGTHRVMPHVLDAADDDQVGGSHRDLPGTRRRRRQRARAHPIDREPGHGVRQTGEQRHVTAERQSLVADLGRGCEDHVADALRGNGRVAAQQLPDDLDRHVVRARLPEKTALACSAEGRTDAVDEDHLAELTGHARRISSLTDRSIKDGFAPAVTPCGRNVCNQTRSGHERLTRVPLWRKRSSPSRRVAGPLPHG